MGDLRFVLVLLFLILFFFEDLSADAHGLFDISAGASGLFGGSVLLVSPGLCPAGLEFCYS